MKITAITVISTVILVAYYKLTAHCKMSVFKYASFAIEKNGCPAQLKTELQLLKLHFEYARKLTSPYITKEDLDVIEKPGSQSTRTILCTQNYL